MPIQHLKTILMDYFSKLNKGKKQQNKKPTCTLNQNTVVWFSFLLESCIKGLVPVPLLGGRTCEEEESVEEGPRDPASCICFDFVAGYHVSSFHYTCVAIMTATLPQTKSNLCNLEPSKLKLVPWMFAIMPEVN